MYRGARIGVVVPVYNEEDFVGQVIDTLPKFVDRVYVVDDHSTDGTWQVIQEHRGSDRPRAACKADGGQVGPSITPIRHESNRGRGGAVKTGYRAAFDDNMDVIAVMDGDGQMDPSRLEDLIQPIVDGVADYAKGNRLERRDHRTEMSNWRLFGNLLLSTLTRVTSGYWGTTDSQNGYTAISREMLETINIQSLYDGYGFLNDMLVRLNAQNARVQEVPMPAIYGDEESGIKYRSFVPSLSLLLAQLFVWRLTTKYILRQFHPVGLMYGFGAVSGLIGAGYVVHWFTLFVDDTARLQTAFLIFGVSGVVLAAAVALDRFHNQHLVSTSEQQ